MVFSRAKSKIKLGVKIDEKLHWIDHSKQIYNKLLRTSTVYDAAKTNNLGFYANQTQVKK